MKKFKVLNLILVISVLLILISGTRVMAVEDYSTKIINVSGEGIVMAKPDLCEIDFSTITTDINREKALRENAVQMDRLIKGFKDWGIKEEDIVTESIFVRPIYDYSQNPRVFKHYHSENRIKVTIRDMEKIGKAIDQGVKLGATEIGYLNYGISNSEELYNKALSLAAIDANKKADTLAKALAVKLEGPIRVEEVGNNNYNRPLIEEVGMDSVKDSGPVTTPIEVKNLEIRGRLQIDYKFN